MYVVGMENRGDEAMPVAPGFHPYFQIAQQDKQRLIVEGLMGFDATTIDWETKPPDTPYPFPHRVTVQFPGKGTLTIEEEAVDGTYSLANMQVWSEPTSAPDHDFVCFEPTVSTEDALNRPQDRLMVEPGRTHQIKLVFKTFNSRDIDTKL